MPTPMAVSKSSQAMQSDFEDELRRAREDFASGDFIDLTIEEIDRCLDAVEFDWAEEP